MNLPILEKYQDFLSPSLNTVLNRLDQIDPQDTTPLLNSILVWLACMHTKPAINQKANELWDKVLLRPFNPKPTTQDYTLEQCLVELFRVVGTEPSQSFSKEMFAALLQYHLPSITKLPGEIYTTGFPLPEVLFNAVCLPDLSEIRITKVNLNALFVNIARFPPIKRLYITHCDFGAWICHPKAASLLTNCPTLERLDLSYNQLYVLPDIVLQLRQLKALKLDNNYLKELPLALFALPQLETLDVKHNQINALPENLPSLESIRLSKLLISHNHLQTLPQQWQNFEHLNHLDIRHNQLKFLPDNLGELPQLETLEINHNQIMVLPEYLNDLQIKEGVYDNIFFEVPAGLVKKRAKILKQKLLKISPKEMTQIFCLAYFSTQEKVRSMATVSLRKYLNTTALKQWSPSNITSSQVLFDFLLKAIRVKPSLDWKVLEAWIDHLHLTQKITPEVDLPKFILTFTKSDQKRVKIGWKKVQKWIQEYGLKSSKQLNYPQALNLFVKISHQDDDLGWSQLYDGLVDTDTLVDEPISINHYYEALLGITNHFNLSQWRRFTDWNQQMEIQFHPTIDFPKLIHTLAKLRQKRPSWDWQQFEILIETNKFKAAKKLSVLQAFDLFIEVQQIFPHTQWSKLHQWMENTQALSKRKPGAKSYLKAILEATQSFTLDQWTKTDIWLEQLPVEINKKSSFRQFVEQLITATQSNPSLNWVLVTKWMREAKAIQPSIERFELLMLLAPFMAKMYDLDWSSLTPWLDHIELEEDQEQGFQKFFHYLHKAGLLYKVNWEWMDTWMEKMKVKSPQKIKIKNQYLESLPQPIFKHWQNASIDLSGNLLDTTPLGLEEIEQIKYLDLSKNLLDTISIQKVAPWQSLKQLKLGFNVFQSFPGALVHCPDLEYLDISHNQLSRSLLSQGKMPQLKTLNLSFNRFEKFPILFAEAFPKLETLDLSFNHLVEVTEQIAELEQLKVLDLSHNQLGKFAQESTNKYRYALPLKISFLEKLTHLHLQHNGLEKLPPGIGLMENLQELDLSDNLLTEFPIEICEAENLEVLNIAHNQISYIPAHLKDMPKLKKLNLSGNPLSAYEVKKVQQLLPSVEILFDTLIPPTFTPWAGKNPKRVAKKAYERGTTYRQRGYTQKALQSFREAAMLDSIEAMMELGYLNQEFDNLPQMAYWLRIAALNGYPVGQIETGEHLKTSQTHNLDQTVYWYTLAAQQGNLQAQLKLSYIYYEGESMNKNMSYAIYWVEKAAQQGDIDAMTLLAKMYEQGEVIPRDYAKAVKWYEKLAAQDQIFAQHKLVEFYRDGLGVEKDLSKVIQLYEKLDTQEETIHFFTLAQGYYQGIGVGQNLGYALHYFEKSAANDEIEGQIMMAKLYLEGEWVDKNHQKALKYLEIGNSKGNAEAQRLLGQMYEQGLGCNPSPRVAASFYEKAAKQGDVDAQYALGEILLQKHHDLGPDYNLAKQWFQDAANQGDERAKKRLGDIYAHGWGVEKDDATAGHWYSQVDSDLLAE